MDNVEKLPGASSSIRNQLTGEGDDHTQSCEAVPGEIQDEAINESPMKRARSSPIGDDINVGVANNKQSSSSSKCSEEMIADTLVEFLISKNVSVSTINDSRFRAFLTMVAQHGSVPSWLLHDDSVAIRRSLLSYEDVVNEHIREVKESWKTTGFTYMFYNLNVLQEDKVSSNTHDQDNLVIGWYSPKGFFFTEGRRFAKLYDKPRKETDLMLSLSMCDAVQYIHHPRDMRLCHYQAWDLTDYYGGSGVRSVWCVENRIQLFCNDICKKSDWVNGLMERSKQIYEYMRMFSASPSRNWMQEHFDRFKYCAYESSFTHLLTIMQLKDELEQWQTIALLEEQAPWSEEMQFIIDDDEFWSDGKELHSALSPLLSAYYIVDRLDPTAGTLFARINEAKCNLQALDCKYDTIWECFDEYFGDLENEKEEASAYLNPAYIRSNEAKLKLSDQGKLALKRFVKPEEHEALDAELEAYSVGSTNPFASLTEHEYTTYKYTDRIELWDMCTGGDMFPLLKRCAMKLLSQPMSCMCNQVKKHMSQIQGSDNLILRLNYKMMAEFKNRAGSQI